MKLFKSRTFYTLVFAFVFNGFQAISGALPPEAVLIIDALFTTAAMYFKLNPSQKY